MTQSTPQPNRINAFQLAKFSIDLHPALAVGKQRIEQRQGLVVSLTDEQQCTFFVEVSPLSGLDRDNQPIHGFSAESLAETEQWLAQQLNSLIDAPITRIAELAEAAPYASVRFGLSILAAKMTQDFNQWRSDTRNVPLVFDGMSPALVEQKVHAATDHFIKVKVAQTSIDSEIAFIHKLLQLNPRLKLRLDANRGFDLAQACDFLSCLPKSSIEYIEEPCIRPQDNPTLYQSVAVKYALDESLNSPDYQFSPEAGLGALVIKPSIFGSISAIQTLVEQAQQHGVQCIFSSALESDIAINDIKILSHAITPESIPGLDTLASFDTKLVESGELNMAALNIIASAKTTRE
ncbi:o-succinylbenzoate synthase [Shewanella maritima]|uniref:o-succinylbenzoate synthase n=1 Tax=Shewanella maritima TaxID=2520507 RepID=UPI0037360414